MSKVVDLFDPDTGAKLDGVPVAEPEVKVDYDRYFNFVNEVTSDASRYTDSFIERIGELQEQGVDVQRLLLVLVLVQKVVSLLRSSRRFVSRVNLITKQIVNT